MLDEREREFERAGRRAIVAACLAIRDHRDAMIHSMVENGDIPGNDRTDSAAADGIALVY